MRILGWDLKQHVIEHHLSCDEGNTSDLKSETATRRMVIRPCEIIIYQQPGSSLVRYVAVKGRQVRRDGSLGGFRIVTVGLASHHDSIPPWWLNAILAALDLTWMSDRQVPIP